MCVTRAGVYVCACILVCVMGAGVCVCVPIFSGMCVMGIGVCVYLYCVCYRCRHVCVPKFLCVYVNVCYRCRGVCVL